MAVAQSPPRPVGPKSTGHLLREVSLVISSWALAVSLPREEIDEMITEVVPDEELSLEPLTG